MGARRRPKRWAPIAVLALAVVLYYADFLAGTVFLWEDGLKTYYPAARYLCAALWRGEFPFWAPGLSCGFPFYADPQSGAFYFPLWLLLPWASKGLSCVTYQRFVIAQLLIGTFFFYRFLRACRLRALPATAGALVYCFSGFPSLHFKHVAMLQAYVWLPPGLWLVRGLAGGFSVGRFLALLAALSLSLTGGHTQTAVYGFLLLAAYWLFCLGWRACLRSLPLVFGTFVLAALLNAYLILPAYEGYRQSWRAGWDSGEAVDQSLPLSGLAAFLAPNYFGTTEDGSSRVPFWGQDLKSRLVQGDLRNGRWQYWEFGAYAGQAALLAFLTVLVNAKRLRRRREALFFAGALAFGVWYMLGRQGGLVEAVSRVLPFLGSFRAPTRMALVLDVSLAVLTAVFLDALQARERLRLGPAVLVLAAAEAALWLYSGRAPDAAAASNAAWQAAQAGTFLAVTAAWAWAAASTRRPAWRWAALAGLTALIFLDLFSAYGRFHRGKTNPDDYYADRAGLLPKLLAEKETVRFAQAVDGHASGDVLFPHNAALVIPGLETVDGDTTFNLAGLEALRGVKNETARLDLQNVRVLANLETKAARLTIDRRPGGLPRAKFYSRVKAYATREELLKALDDQTLDYKKEAAVVGGAWAHPSGRPKPGVARFRWEGPRRYAVEYEAPSPGLIFVSESFYPGWRIIAGEGRLIETFGAFQGIALDKPGRGTIVARFEPPLFRLGLWISVLTAAGLAVFLVLRSNMAQRP